MNGKNDSYELEKDSDLGLDGRIAEILHRGESVVLMTILSRDSAQTKRFGEHAIYSANGFESEKNSIIQEDRVLEYAQEAFNGGYSRVVKCDLYAQDSPEESYFGSGGALLLCEFLVPAQAEMFMSAAAALQNNLRGAWIIDLRDPDSPKRALCLEKIPDFSNFKYLDKDSENEYKQAVDSNIDMAETTFGLTGALPQGVNTNFASASSYLEQMRGRAGLIKGKNPLYVEPISAPPVLLLCGADDLAVEIAELAHAVGFTIDVVDDRAEYANLERFPMAHKCLVLPDFHDLVAECGVGRQHFVVILTRAQKYDRDALWQVLESHAQYIGMIGNKAKRDEIYDFLREQGVPNTELACVCCPIGLPLEAETSQQIAVAIVAELLAARAGTIKRLRQEDISK